MEGVVFAAIAILSVVFIGSLMALIFVCRHKYCLPVDLISSQFVDVRAEENLIKDEYKSELELDDVRLHPNIEKILSDDQWVDDVTGLIPHCLAILKKCHHLTERLVAMTMTNVSIQTQQHFGEIIQVARKISSRVDDVVGSMYPPLDPRLLEARCFALIISVSNLALVTKSVCPIRSAIDWIENAMLDMEENLQVLRDAANALDATSAPYLQDDARTFNCIIATQPSEIRSFTVTASHEI